MPFRVRQPLERLVRWLMVAKTDSIGLLVRMQLWVSRPSSVPPFLDLYGLELLFRITGWNFPKLGAHVFKWASWFTGINVITQHDDQV